MNKSRRMAALQSRALAANGYAVLQIDLRGCGDSSGDFSDATPDRWNADIAAAWDWIHANVHQSVVMWGLRLGATLALDFCASQKRLPTAFLLWQPVLSGELFMTQFLRLRVASEMLDGTKTGGTKALRESIDRGELEEIAGYRLNPRLVAYIDTLQISKISPLNVPVNWLEITTGSARGPTPATTRVAEVWRQAGIDLELDTIAGRAFWSTQEITDCPDLVAKTMVRIDRLIR